MFTINKKKNNKLFILNKTLLIQLTNYQIIHSLYFY